MANKVLEKGAYESLKKLHDDFVRLLQQHNAQQHAQSGAFAEPPAFPEFKEENGKYVIDETVYSKYETDVAKWKTDYEAHVKADPAPAANAKPAPKPDVKPATNPNANVPARYKQDGPSDVIADVQSFHIFLKAGGFAPLANEEVSERNYWGGPLTAHPMAKVTGKSLRELWRTPIADVQKSYEDRMKTDPFRDAVLKGLRAHVTTDPTQVELFLKARGITVENGDLTGAIDKYATSLGVTVAPTPNPDSKLGDDLARRSRRSEPPADRYAGINWDDEYGSSRVIDRRDGTYSYRAPRGISDDAIRDADIRGDRVRFRTSDQTDGIRDKGLHSEDKDWYDENRRNPRALYNGVLTLGDNGKLYITRAEPRIARAEPDDDRPGLIRRRVDDYIQETGPNAFVGVPFRMESSVMPRVRNAFQALSDTPGFNARDGMILQGQGYKVRVYEDANGGMQMTVVGNPKDAASVRAEMQTPREIREDWHSGSAFKSESGVREIINASGIFKSDGPVSRRVGEGCPDVGADFNRARGREFCKSDPSTALGADTAQIDGTTEPRIENAVLETTRVPAQPFGPQKIA